MPRGDPHAPLTGGTGCFGLRYEYGMSQSVWWEIETPTPEASQQFHGHLWGWTLERAFADTELGAEYWMPVTVPVSRGGW
jgi:hypothetical protein